ncbi:hypothetical protein MMC30_008401 [Trapelia coarctata]|nr:hypothetical protein [Trapelia coarctata]
MDVLPKSFRDAVLITRKLGYRYLWVDSLCIVQDDQSDWAREAANMGDIYRGATCTIAALAARNSQAGCFVKRNPLAIRSCRILGNAKNGIYVRGRDIVMEFHTHGKVSSAQPLHERAWVVQEQLLSPRTLYYGSEAILWECVELDATEGRPQGNTWDWKEDRRYRRPKEAFMSLMLSPRAVPGVVDDEFRSFYQAWAKVLRDYSSCSLTRPEDKLVAISGIIRVIEKRTGLQSVAGMWREYFLQEMIWRTFVPVQRPSPYRAPSWSWASIDNAVILDYLQLEQNYELEGRMELLHLEAPPTTPVSQHPLLLPRAYMRVRAALRRVYWHHTVDREPYYLHLEPESGWTQDHWYPDVPPEPSLEIWCMRILHGKALKDQLGSRVDIGSILTKCEGPKNTWTRVGYFQQHHSDMSRERAFFGPGIATQLIDIV